ncbi:MAG: hypothetical protein Q9209_005927 [Squamulea sp. 1 TL-2023]
MTPTYQALDEETDEEADEEADKEWKRTLVVTDKGVKMRFNISTATVTFTEDHNGNQFKLIKSPTFSYRIYIGNVHISDTYDEARADKDFAGFKHDSSKLVALRDTLLEQYSKKELDPNIPAHTL